MSDEAIVGGLRDGSAEAARALYERFQDAIHRLVWRVLGGDGEHDDVVQQVFENALGSIFSIRDPAALESWMIGTALNTVRRELRTRTRRRAHLASGELPEVACETSDPDRQLLIRRFYAAVRRMRPDDQIAFTLRFVEGHSLDEVALMCSCSRTTIKRRLNRARRSFERQARRDPVLDRSFEVGEE